MKAPVTYHPKFVPDADAAFESLKNDLEWERRDDAPRCEYYCNDYPKPYIYGRGNGRRLYEPRPYHAVVLSIRKALEETTKATYEVCFLNRYLNQSDHLGWHADDSPEMDDARPIVTVSLGVEREIWFREKKEAVRVSTIPMMGSVVEELVYPIEKLKLEHGSAAIMATGMQDAWQHRIPKAGFQCGERISLTFRGYVNA
jgi:alkylated DNA repair dioxygenase AlkB